MEIQKVLLLLAASWLCSDAADKKNELLRVLLSNYESDVGPFSTSSTTVVSMSLSVLCATPVSDFVTIESWIRMVSRVGSAELNVNVKCQY